MMTHDQIIDLLSLAAARDRRTIGRADVLAWHDDIGDLPLDDCREAIGIHFRESTEWLLPAHVRRIAKRLRDERGGVPGPGLSPPIPDADPDDVPAYLAALRRQAAASAAGQDVPALEAGETASYDDNPHVRQILRRFEAEREGARRRKVQQDTADREALKVYREAVEELLALSDHGQAATEQARAELLSEAEAAAGFPRLAALAGVTDEHKIVIRAAHLAAKGDAA
ncbi:hypothetical protein [Spirillospora sp. NBC_01491]|uniref:hypothetical protein n=1 Tax=Spirillospora sp. NBC_01491 TaxID=2976007 RepID=UPI002E2F5C0E|nr:hypothetical protein [Spirillospora sp. NBC_01491]